MHPPNGPELIDYTVTLRIQRSRVVCSVQPGGGLVDLRL